MKYFYTLVLVVFLASCTATQTPIEDTTENKTNTEINTELENLDSIDMESNNEEMESNVVKLDAKYENPQTEVDMVVEYSLDENEKIKTISISATNFDLTQYNENVQVVVGKTLEEAYEANIAGGSLTIAAFKNAIKQ